MADELGCLGYQVKKAQRVVLRMAYQGIFTLFLSRHARPSVLLDKGPQLSCLRASGLSYILYSNRVCRTDSPWGSRRNVHDVCDGVPAAALENSCPNQVQSLGKFKNHEKMHSCCCGCPRVLCLRVA